MQLANLLTTNYVSTEKLRYIYGKQFWFPEIRLEQLQNDSCSDQKPTEIMQNTNLTR